MSKFGLGIMDLDVDLVESIWIRCPSGLVLPVGDRGAFNGSLMIRFRGFWV